MSGTGEKCTAPVLVVAADYPAAAGAIALAGQLSGLPVWLKVGLELFVAEGKSLLNSLSDMGYPLFLDLKFHDIPNTVQGAVRSASRLGVRMTTVHLAGGEAMCRAAVAGREQALAAGSSGPLLMGVTVLTSQGGDVRDLVLERALLAKACGLDGVVCSGREVAAVKGVCGRDFLCLCPGIRFPGPANDDQARVCRPAEAVKAGADFLVVGRPVTGDPSPGQAAVRFLEDMRPQE